MIDIDVNLFENGSAQLVKSDFNNTVYFGYAKNVNVYRLHLNPSGIWAGLTIRAFYHTADEKPPAQLSIENYVAVPNSVTAITQRGNIVFEGTGGERTVVSANLPFVVGENAGIEDGDAPEPGSSSWEQYVAEVQASASAAEQSARDAQAALKELKAGIASGDFRGPQGEQGPVGPEGPQGPKGDTPNNAVLYTKQTLTEAEKRTARDNIGADGSGEFVLVFDETLTEDWITSPYSEAHVITLPEPLFALKLFIQYSNVQKQIGALDAAVLLNNKPVARLFCNMPRADYSDDTYQSTIVGVVVPQYGVFNEYTLSGTQGGPMSINYSSNGSNQLDTAVEMNSIRLYIYDVNALKAGSRVQIYGVKANG